MWELAKNNVNHYKEDEHKEKSEQEKCFICNDNDNNICLFPCQHGGICITCISKLKNCPLCKKEIKIIFILEKKLLKNENNDTILTFEIKDFVQPNGINEILLENNLENEFSDFEDF